MAVPFPVPDLILGSVAVGRRTCGYLVQSVSVIRTMTGPPAHGSSITSSARVTNKLVFLLLWVEEPPFMTQSLTQG